MSAKGYLYVTGGKIEDKYIKPKSNKNTPLNAINQEHVNSVVNYVERYSI